VILVDAGPLIALVRKDDQHHKACVAALRRINEPMGTVWPALTEALYLLGDVCGGQEAVWELVTEGGVDLLPLDLADVPRIRELMRKYADLPMDLADAALVRVAEREGITRFFTTDREDFAVYRLNGKIRPVVMP
jgi:hypothetical protein